MIVVCVPSKANSANWSVYYVPGGANQKSQTVTIYSSGGGYVATCTGVSGDSTCRIATISSRYTESVSFTNVGSLDISYKWGVMIPVSTISFNINLNSGSDDRKSAALTGTVRGK